MARTSSGVDRRALSRGSSTTASTGFLTLYVAGAWWGEQLIAGAATPWYPPPGLTVVLVIAFGVRFVPLATLAELVSSIVVFQVEGCSTASPSWS